MTVNPPASRLATLALYWALGAGEPGWWVYLAAGLAYQALLLAALLWRFERVMWQ